MPEEGFSHLGTLGVGGLPGDGGHLGGLVSGALAASWGGADWVFTVLQVNLMLVKCKSHWARFSNLPECQNHLELRCGFKNLLLLNIEM